MINVPWMIPTVDEPMSSYTAMAITFIVILGAIVVIVGYNWMKREFKDIHDTISKHDGFVEQTSIDVSTLTTNVAVLIERSSRSQEDIESIKKSIDDIQHTLLVLSKK